MEPTTDTPSTQPDSAQSLPETPSSASPDLQSSPDSSDVTPVVAPVIVLPPDDTAPSKRRFSWLIVLVVLIIVGAGLYLVYHYGQTKSTPATAVKKDVSILRIGAAEPLPVSIY